MEQCRPRYGVILSPSAERLPIDVSAFGSFGRTELEIGFGNGEYTVKRAAADPDMLLFGMEVSQACVLRCARRAAGLNNLRIIRTDARWMTGEMFRDGTFDMVYMNFPCPWPKRRHANRRVTSEGFSDCLASVLKQGGIFELVTDDEPYALEARDVLGAHRALRTVDFEINPNRPVTTKYERKWLAEGKRIFRVTFERTSPFSTERKTWGNDDLHFRTKNAPNADIAASFKGRSGGRGDAHWSFGSFCTCADGALLIEAFTSDDEFEQRFYIRMSERDGGGLTQLDRTANAFLTPAVRAALADAASVLDAAGGIVS